ncbi:MAG: ATP-binding protein [Planctomycetia bacterium]|nr:ATP-binding protein [Planctomycetia bacterium]
MTNLKPWRQVAIPHADIRQGKFDSSVFAADLGEVLADRGAADYKDAATFFAKTYLTDGLSKLVIDVLRRLAGSGKAEPVIQLQTAFGGGKTHTLLTLYHLLKKPDETGKLQSVKDLVQAAGLKQIPTANVACLVGTALNPANDRTFWGEMAWQLGGEKLYGGMAKNDELRIAPGSTDLGALLQEAGPSLILVDELLIYLLKAGGIKVEDSTLRGHTLTFLQELSIAVANCPHAILVATLTSQLPEFLDENGERVYQSLEKVLGRIEKVRQTVEGAEIYEVIRRRLFEDLGDPSHHKAAAQEYWEMYRGLGEDVPSGCREPSYRNEIERAYPFHPELISVLYERWGTIPEFQRTRGVLRLLADVIANLYQAKDNEVLISSASVNLGAAAVRSELVKHTGSGSVFHSVIESDISGSHAKAAEIDRQLGSEYAKESVAEKLARATFMYSFSGGQQRGATLPQLRVAVLNPEMAPPFISDALDRMTKRLWYLYHDNGLYRFDSRANLNRILVDQEELIRSEPGRVMDFVKTTLNDMIGDAVFRVYRYPQPGDDSFVGDEPRLSLVVLDLGYGATEEALAKETEDLVGRILKQHGKGFRKYANMLIFLAPDQQRVSEVTDAARRLLALRGIDEHKLTKAQLTEEQLKDLAGRLKEAAARLPAALMTAYRHILVPAEKKTIQCISLDLAMSRATLSQRVLDKLKDEQRILEKLDPAILIGDRFGLWPEDKEVVSVCALADYFTQLTHLPRLLNSGVLPDCVAKGVQRGLFGYALGNGEKREFDTIFFGDKQITAGQCEVTESAWLLRAALAKSLMPEPAAGGVPGAGAGAAIGGGLGGAPGGEAGSDEGWTGGGGAKLVDGERRLSRVRVAMTVPWENWNDIYNEVIDPLAKEGADVRCDVVVIAKGDDAIRENTVELGIRESLSQRGIEADIQTG